MTSLSASIRNGFILGACALLGGCNIIPAPLSDPTRYYVLDGPALPPGAANAPIGNIRLGLKVIDVPAYLRGREMVLRDGANQLYLEDYARWAETLQAGLTRVLKRELQANPAIGRLDAAPFPFDGAHDYDVAISIVRCEGATEGGREVARFAAIIEVTTGGTDPQLVARKEFAAPEVPWNGKDYSELAAGLSQGVAALGREIVAALPPK
jgi:uncharacterized lipoprotein YmbA